MTSQPRLTRTTPPPAPGIVHLGPGAFFRAFIAPFTDEAMNEAGGSWGITAVSLKSTGARDALMPQGCLYTALERGSDGDIARTVGALTTVLVAAEDPGAVLAAMERAETRIVTLTVTEKGYCHNPRDGRLLTDHPDILHDARTLDSPRSALGFLVLALARRRDLGHPPFTVLCCDNLPANGAMLRSLVIELASQRDAAGSGNGLADWIARHVAFPATMVDRITPATMQEDITALAAATGHRDAALVVHEPFRQWVIEDSFPQGRPAWHRVGAQMVADVERHELMKLRCLNGTHSALAYLGYLAGHKTISDAVADPAFTRLCERLWREEILPTVPQPEGEDLTAYCAALMSRYRNPAIRHRTWQIAMDGSQKLPQRILGPLRDHLKHGHVPKGLCLVIAGWMRYVRGIDEVGEAIDVRDPMVEDVTRAARAPDPVGNLLAIEAIFGTDLVANPALVGAIADAHDDLAARGAAAAVASYVDSTPHNPVIGTTR
ncbi:MAG: mannitol dehydrogenase family protein [Candidatus Puniceispirillaceae bacterium]